MAQILKLRRSAVPGNKPTISQLEFGEIAMNTYDGRLFMRRSSSLGDEVVEIGANLSGSLNINNSLISNQTTSSIGSGAKIISTNPTGSYTSAFYNYNISSGSNTRSGQVIAAWYGSNIKYTDNSTTDIGNTYGVEFTASLNSGNIQLSSIFPSSGWNIKTLINFL